MTAPRFLPFYVLLLLAGCATRISEPTHLGQGVYMMLGSTFGPLTSTYDVVTDVERRASSFCKSDGGKALEVVRIDTPELEVGSFPEGRLQFRCVKLAQHAASDGAGLN